MIFKTSAYWLTVFTIFLYCQGQASADDEQKSALEGKYLSADRLNKISDGFQVQLVWNEAEKRKELRFIGTVPKRCNVTIVEGKSTNGRIVLHADAVKSCAEPKKGEAMVALSQRVASIPINGTFIGKVEFCSQKADTDPAASDYLQCDTTKIRDRMKDQTVFYIVSEAEQKKLKVFVDRVCENRFVYAKSVGSGGILGISGEKVAIFLEDQKNRNLDSAKEQVDAAGSIAELEKVMEMYGSLREIKDSVRKRAKEIITFHLEEKKIDLAEKEMARLKEWRDLSSYPSLSQGERGLKTHLREVADRRTVNKLKREIQAGRDEREEERSAEAARQRKKKNASARRKVLVTAKATGEMINELKSIDDQAKLDSYVEAIQNSLRKQFALTKPKDIDRKKLMQERYTPFINNLAAKGQYQKVNKIIDEMEKKTVSDPMNAFRWRVLRLGSKRTGFGKKCAKKANAIIKGKKSFEKLYGECEVLAGEIAATYDGLSDDIRENTKKSDVGNLRAAIGLKSKRYKNIEEKLERRKNENYGILVQKLQIAKTAFLSSCRLPRVQGGETRCSEFKCKKFAKIYRILEGEDPDVSCANDGDDF